MDENKVKIVVKSSKCHLYKPGDKIYIDGPVLNKEKSAQLTFQCSDCPETVEFTIVTY